MYACGLRVGEATTLEVTAVDRARRVLRIVGKGDKERLVPLPIKALARKVRGKVRALLRRRCPDLVVPDAVWHTDWIAHVTAWGQGEQAVLDYLARYVFRIAITNARIVGLDDAGVTVAYRNRKTGRQCTCRLGGDEFPSRWGCCHPHPSQFRTCRFPASGSSRASFAHVGVAMDNPSSRQWIPF